MEKNKYLSQSILEAGVDVSTPILSKASTLSDQGAPIIRMDMGIPDIDAPDVAKKAAIKALNEGKNQYTDIKGIHELRKAIAYKEKKDHGLNYDIESEILVTVGASEALISACATFLDPGDEVIIPTPCYCAYLYVLTALGIKVVEMPIVKSGKIHINIDEMSALITDKTRMILVNSPHNPTGTVYNQQQLESIADLAITHDLLVISDECYDKYVFSGEMKSIAALPNMRERTIVINSVSKSYGLTGWRVGYLLAPSQLYEYISMLHGNLVLCAPSFAQ